MRVLEEVPIAGGLVADAQASLERVQPQAHQARSDQERNRVLRARRSSRCRGRATSFGSTRGRSALHRPGAAGSRTRRAEGRTSGRGATGTLYNFDGKGTLQAGRVKTGVADGLFTEVEGMDVAEGMKVVDGLVGLIVGFTGASVLAHITGRETVISPLVMIGAVGFSGAAGAFFGFDPARRQRISKSATTGTWSLATREIRIRQRFAAKSVSGPR